MSVVETVRSTWFNSVCGNIFFWPDLQHSDHGLKTPLHSHINVYDKGGA